RKGHTEVRHIIRIVFFEFSGALDVLQGFRRVVISKQRQARLEFTEGFSIHHRTTSSRLQDSPGSTHFGKAASHLRRRSDSSARATFAARFKTERESQTSRQAEWEARSSLRS